MDEERLACSSEVFPASKHTKYEIQNMYIVISNLQNQSIKDKEQKGLPPAPVEASVHMLGWPCLS